jgi:hypothetical protein
MNTILKIGVAGALALGYASAHASITQPSTGSSDLILFAEVLNSSGAEVASYAANTGISIVSGSATPLVSQTVLAGDANLAALFAADNVAAGDTIVWSVQGGAFVGGAITSNFGKKGVAQFATTASNNALSIDTVGNLTKWAGTFGNDIVTLNGNFGSGSSVEGANPATAGIWDQTSTAINVTNWYGNGPTTAQTLGSTDTLFGVTGNGGPTSKVVTTSLGTVDLTAGGLVIAGNTPVSAVPLPAAVWLLGSGLLGLAGIGRRKAISA